MYESTGKGAFTEKLDAFPVLETYNGSDFGNEAAVLDINFDGALCLFLRVERPQIFERACTGPLHVGAARAVAGDLVLVLDGLDDGKEPRRRQRRGR